MDPITIAMGLASVIPNVLKYLGHEHSAKSAEKIIDIAQQVTGTSSGADALAAVKNNPTLALQLQQEINRNNEELLRIELAGDSAFLQDRQNARARQIASEQATGHVDYAVYILAGIIVTGFFLLTALLCKITLPEDSNGVVFMLFGSLASAFGAVVQYFFGSSRGSREKTKILAGR